MRVIDADAMLARLEEWNTSDSTDKALYNFTLHRILEQPTIEPQPTLYGYNVKHLELIARVLQKENLPPERVTEALSDIGRIVAIVKDEFEETLQRAAQNIEWETNE